MQSSSAIRRTLPDFIMEQAPTNGMAITHLIIMGTMQTEINQILATQFASFAFEFYLVIWHQLIEINTEAIEVEQELVKAITKQIEEAEKTDK